jgi:hypothetical protein
MQHQLQSTEQLRDRFDGRVRKGIFRPILRRLHQEIAEDRLQEGVSQCFVIAKRRFQRDGQILDDALLVHIARVRAHDMTRHLNPTDGRRKSDVYNFKLYQAGNVELLHIGGVVDEDDEDHRLLVGMAEVMCGNPTRKIHSAHDLNTWLMTLTENDRHVLALRQTGHGLQEIGAELGKSCSWVFGRLRELGRALQARVAA